MQFNRNLSYYIKHLLPLLSVIILTGILLGSGLCIYETNDDIGMIALLSGQLGIKASADAIFLSIPLGKLLYQLYKFNSSVPWYGLVMYGALVLGCTIGLRAIVEVPTATRNKIICAAAILGFYITIATRLNFTSVSLFLWFTVNVRIIQANLSNRSFSATDLASGCLLSLSYLIRPDILPVALMFSVPTVVTLCMSPRKKMLVAILVPLGMAMVMETTFAQIEHKTAEYSSFSEFNKVRGDFTDTALGDPNSQTSQALNKAGWNTADYYVAKQWWFHDSSLFNAQKFKSFITYNNNHTYSIVSLRRGLEYLLEQKANLCVVLLCLVIFLINRQQPASLGRNRQRIILLALFATILSFMLLTMIRFPLRIAIPVFANLVLLGIVFRPFVGDVLSIKNGRLSWAIFSACFAGVLYMIASNCSSLIELLPEIRQVNEYSSVSIKKAQAIVGEDAIFLNAGLGNAGFNLDTINPLREYQDVVPFIKFPMGCSIASPAYNAFLRDNGLIDREHVVSRMINNGRIVMCYWDTPLNPFYSYMQVFLNHLQAHYGPLFPNKSIQVQIILDRRTSNYNGWVFFYIRALPNINTHQVSS